MKFCLVTNKPDHGNCRMSKCDLLMEATRNSAINTYTCVLDQDQAINDAWCTYELHCAILTLTMSIENVLRSTEERSPKRAWSISHLWIHKMSTDVKNRSHMVTLYAAEAFSARTNPPLMCNRYSRQYIAIATRRETTDPRELPLSAAQQRRPKMNKPIHEHYWPGWAWTCSGLLSPPGWE